MVAVLRCCTRAGVSALRDWRRWHSRLTQVDGWCLATCSGPGARLRSKRTECVGPILSAIARSNREAIEEQGDAPFVGLARQAAASHQGDQSVQAGPEHFGVHVEVVVAGERA